MSKLGFLKWFKFAETILPYTLAAAGVPQDKIGSVVSLVGHAESALGDGSGSDKLTHVLAGVADGMKASGASEATIAAVQQAATEGINAGVALTNDVHKIAEAHAGPTPIAGV